mgnify:CR=1 FL=1
MYVPPGEKVKFEAILTAEANRYGLSPYEYMRKVWYHETAAKLGEYVAAALSEEVVRGLLLKEATDEPNQTGEFRQPHVSPNKRRYRGVDPPQRS